MNVVNSIVDQSKSRSGKTRVKINITRQPYGPWPWLV